MNKKHLAILLVIFLVLALGVFAKKIHKPVELVTQETEPLKISVDSSKIDQIQIKMNHKKEEAKPAPTDQKPEAPKKEESGKPSEISLIKKDEVWTIPALWSSKVDPEKTKRLFEETTKLQGELRGNSKDLLKDFGITDEEALHIIFAAASKEQLHLLVGSKKLESPGFFIRRAADNAVYFSNSELLSTIGIYGDIESAEIQPEIWSDLNLIKASSESIEKVETKVNDTWKQVGTNLPFPIDESKLKAQLQNAATLRASAVVDPKGEGYGFDKPFQEYKLSIKGSDPLLITVGGLKKDSTTDRYVKLSNQDSVYTVSQYALDKLKLDASILMQNNPLGVEKEKIQTLTVQVPGQEFTLQPKTESWPDLDKYIEDLKMFTVSALSESDVPGEKPYSVKITSEGKEPVQISCVKAESGKNAICTNAKNNIPFNITNETFQALFDNVAVKLKKPEAKEEPKPAVTTEQKEAPASKPEEEKKAA